MNKLRNYLGDKDISNGAEGKVITVCMCMSAGIYIWDKVPEYPYRNFNDHKKVYVLNKVVSKWRYAKIANRR